MCLIVFGLLFASACDCDKLTPTDVQLPDLVVRSMGSPSVTCPGGNGTCVTRVEVEIANQGKANAGPFRVEATMDPSGSVIVSESIPGLAAGESIFILFVSPEGGNCYDPDCFISVVADPDDAIIEEDESNNTLDQLFLG